MPAYIKSPFKPTPRLMVAGTPEYVWGSKDNKSSDTFGYVLSNSSTGSTQTVVFQIMQGNIPVVSAASPLPYNLLVTIVGSQNNANFNCTNATVLTASTDANGICTITFSNATFSQGATPDGGQVIIPVPEIGENFVNGASAPVATPFNNPQVQQGRTVNATVVFPTQPTSGQVYLQGAINDVDSEYNTIGLVATAGSPSTLTTLEVIESAYRFYRLLNTGVNGAASGTIVGKITC